MTRRDPHLSDHSKECKQTRKECTQTRLAQGSVAAIDVCSCGMMRLHLGAITLRLAPCAISDLQATLGEAITQYAARQAGESRAPDAGAFLVGKRGDA